VATVRRSGRTDPKPLNILIPTLNEAAYLPWAVAQARLRAALDPPHENIVADCDSVEDTAGLATRLGTHLVRGQRVPS
jgi:hypothetical protein